MEMLDYQQPMTVPFKRGATYDDLSTIPETWVGQIIDGDLYALPRAASLHALALGALRDALGPMIHDRSPSGWVILLDVEVAFGPHLLVPDIVGWRRERMPVVPDLTVFELSPDWVCEGLSPSTARLDRGRKREIYAAGGVGHLWFCDPEDQTLEILTLDGGSYRVTHVASGDDRGVFAPFPHAIELAKLWHR